MTAIAISVLNVSKCYRVFDDPRSRLLHSLWPHYTKGMQEVWALKDINLEVKRGDSFAVIGRNGGGKSTLLEIITQTLAPTTGEVRVNGRIAALLELGSGFNPEYTGRENVFLNGLLLGLTRAQVQNRFDDIASFADIGNVLDRPVKTYSSGMLVRLAFAVQVALEPEILIVDEALSVGDYFFQQKCFGRLRKMREDGLTLLFVSHDMGTVRDLCRHAIYLRHGEEACSGDAESVIRTYFAEGDKRSSAISSSQIVPHPDKPSALPSFGPDIAWSRQAWDGKPLFAVRSVNADGMDITSARIGDTVRIEVYFSGCKNVDGLRVALTIKNRYDQIVSSRTSERLGFTDVVSQDGPYSCFEFEMDLMLEAGLYSMRIFLGHARGGNMGAEIDSTEWFGPLHVNWDYENEAAPFLGMFGIPMRGRIANATRTNQQIEA